MKDESDSPLLRGDKVVITELNKYVELLTVESDALTDLLVGHIKIDINDTTALPEIKVDLDGKPFLNDYPLLVSSLSFDWGRHLRLHGKHNKPIVIQIKQTVAGAGNLRAAACVDGLEVPARQ